MSAQSTTLFAKRHVSIAIVLLSIYNCRQPLCGWITSRYALRWCNPPQLHDVGSGYETTQTHTTNRQVNMPFRHSNIPVNAVHVDVLYNIDLCQITEWSYETWKRYTVYPFAVKISNAIVFDVITSHVHWFTTLCIHWLRTCCKR